MKFKLVEDIQIEPYRYMLDEEMLNEATEPQYRNILLELIYYITPNQELKKLIKTSKEILEFHHIDAMYTYIVKTSKSGKEYKIGAAINNTPQNIAIATNNAHKELTNINNEIKKTVKALGRPVEEAVPQILSKFDDKLNELKDEIFPLLDCLPPDLVNSLSKIIDD